MPLYEHIYLARQDITTQQVDALTQNLKTIISDGGGTIGKVEYWGVKQLQHRIKKNRKAHFTLININANAETLAEMERQIGINEDIIRHLTIKVDKHEDSPSMMMAGKTSYNERKPPLLVEVEKETKDLKVEKLDAVSEKIVIEEEKK
ncbi:MAG: 30S ribosomal protein S6 [Alphaproteobacteria bacterium]|jgi:small subunit ribosomal protein S6|tara:strand:- start:25675 stop:26118 length:444 start_codon:yes stop_codon:yes gene_type:complete